MVDLRVDAGGRDPDEGRRREDDAELDEAVRNYAFAYGPEAMFESLAAWMIIMADQYPTREVSIETEDGSVTIRPRR